MCYYGTMSNRSKELDRIVKYAAGLGIKVTWKKYERGGNGAEWTIDGTEITMYRWPRKSKTQDVLDFVHEFAHHMAWIARDKTTPLKHERALDADAAGVATKEHNRQIYEMECADARYQERIFKELQLTIPMWRFKANKKHDMWIYKQIWLKGKKPSEKAMKLKRRELEARFKRKYET